MVEFELYGNTRWVLITTTCLLSSSRNAARWQRPRRRSASQPRWIEFEVNSPGPPLNSPRIRLEFGGHIVWFWRESQEIHVAIRPANADAISAELSDLANDLSSYPCCIGFQAYLNARAALLCWHNR
eukprot:8913851-Pyramimonas_sp.AAC.1